MPLLINIIHYNSSYLDENVVSGVVRLVDTPNAWRAHVFKILCAAFMGKQNP